MEPDDDSARGGGQKDIVFRNGAHARMKDIHADLFRGQLLQGLDNGFGGAADIRLHDHLQIVPFARFLHLREQILQRGSGALAGQRLQTVFRSTLLRQFAGLRKGFADRHPRPGLRHAGKPHDLHGRARSGKGDPVSAGVDQGFDLAAVGAADDGIAHAEGSVFDYDAGGGTEALFQLGFQHIRHGRTLGIRAKLQHFRFQQNPFQKHIHAHAGLRGNTDRGHLTAPFFRHEIVLLHIEQDLVRIRSGKVHLVDGHDDRHSGRLRVIHGLDGLGHESVIRGHDQHDDIRHVGAACAHLGERLVTGRVDERDRLSVDAHHRGANVLGDTSRLTRRHVGLADRVLKRRLAVVHVPHKGHDRRTRLQISLVVLKHTVFRRDIGGRLPFRSRRIPSASLVDDQDSAELRRHLFGDLIVHRLIDAGQDVHHHESRDDLVGLPVDGIRQRLHDHGTLYMHLRGGRALCRGRRSGWSRLRFFHNGRRRRRRGQTGCTAVLRSGGRSLGGGRCRFLFFRSGRCRRNGLAAGLSASCRLAFRSGRGRLYRSFGSRGRFFGGSGCGLRSRSRLLGGGLFFPFPAGEFIEIGGHQFQFRGGDIRSRSPDRSITQGGKLLQNITGRHAVLIGKRLHFHILFFHSITSGVNDRSGCRDKPEAHASVLP